MEMHHGGNCMTKKQLWKKIQMTFAAGGVMMTMLAGPAAPVAHAEDWGNILGGVIGISNTYNQYLSALLSLGNDPRQQNAALTKDMEDNGRCYDEETNAVVTSVMEQLIDKGEYAMMPDSLPFRWRVNNSEEFNAFCTAMDYVSVNRGAVEQLNYNRDELAGVLAHEMIHGLKQHVAYDNAKTIATQYGVSLLQGSTDILTGTLLQVMANYNAAKNYTAPLENEADEMGFYLMASAGFNPGGFPAMVSRMPDSPGESLLNPDNHPETRTRLTRGAKWMSDYGFGHVTVDGTTVLIDGTPLVTMQADDTLSGVERAYFVAGGISKGFHDNRLASTWFFKQTGNTISYLNDDEVYRPLKEAVREAGVEGLLQQLVEAAYKSDAKTGNREKYLAEEKERRDDIKKEQQKALKKSEENIATYEHKSDTYNALGLTKLAVHEANRLLAVAPNSAFAHGELGWAHYQEGNYAASAEEHKKAIAIDPMNNWNHLRLGYACSALGDVEGALAACAFLDKNAPGRYNDEYLLKGKIFDQMGDEAKAQRAFAQYISVAPDGIDAVPERYRMAIKEEKERVEQKYSN